MRHSIENKFPHNLELCR